MINRRYLLASNEQRYKQLIFNRAVHYFFDFKNSRDIFMQKRDSYFDMLRGIVIVLTVFEHCIQCGNGEKFLNSCQFYNNIIFKTICSFHMPLFMMISGYFFYFSCIRNDKTKIITKKFYTLIIPALSWKTIKVIIIDSIIFDESFNSLTIRLVKGYMTGYWYAWAVFCCSIVVIVVRARMRDSLLVYWVIFLLSLFFPDFLNTKMIVFMYPFFIIGYFINKFDLINNLMNSYYGTRKICFIFIVIWIALLIFYRTDSYIYTTGICIVKQRYEQVYVQLIIDFYRWGIGVIGGLGIAIVVKLIFPVIRKIRVLSIIGQHTVLIYFLGGILTGTVLPIFTRDNDFSLINNFLQTIVILITCEIMYYILAQNAITRKLLIGK